MSAGNAYTFQLVVNDGAVNSIPDAVQITVSEQATCTQNVALGKSAIASSQEGPFAAVNAFDGDGNSRWASNYADDEWIRVDLGGSYNICEIVLNWEAAYGSAYDIRLGATTDLNASTVIATVANGDGGTDNVTTNSSASGRYVWMRGISRGTGWGYSLYEMEVYGSSTSARMGIESTQMNELKGISIYPNPVRETLFIQLDEAQQVNTIEVLSIDGKLLKSHSVDGLSSEINVADLKSGMYLLRIRGEETQSSRFIKE